MHATSLHKLDKFSQSIHGLEPHTLAAILAIIMVGYLVAVLSMPGEHHTSVDLFGSSHVLHTLTRLDDPQYAHEYATRIQAINKGLEHLREVTQSDRAYLVVYNYDPFQPGIPGSVRISQSVEVGQEGVPSQISAFHDLPRREWLRMKEGERPIHWFGQFHPPNTYGLELTNDQHLAIGYVGFEYRQGVPRSQVDNMNLLRQAATAMTTSLLQPLERVN